jgi:hypothetical protein
MAVRQKTTGGISPEIAFLGLDLVQDQSHLEVVAALWPRIARAVAGDQDSRFMQITPSLYFDPDEGRITTRKREGCLFLGKFTVRRSFEGWTKADRDIITIGLTTLPRRLEATCRGLDEFQADFLGLLKKRQILFRQELLGI